MFKASKEKSLAITREWGSSAANVIPMMPEPVPRSRIFAVEWGFSRSKHSSMINSVSGLGINTSDVTLKSRDQNSL